MRFRFTGNHMVRFVVLITVCGGALAQEPVLDPEQSQAIAAWVTAPLNQPGSIDELDLPASLTIDQANELLSEMWEIYRGAVNDQEVGPVPIALSELAKAGNGQINIQPRALTLGEGLSMPFVALLRETAPPPEAGRPLLICTHGGGRRADAPGPHAWPVNTREWQTQVRFAAQLYGLEGIYIVPRMADDRMGRWWHKHNQDAFERFAEHAVAHWGVDPNRIYLLGISEGGYGTAILAPFMPDRFGGANAMAAGVNLGNPAENLRNLAFRTDVGENDTMFNRQGLAVKFHTALDALHAEDAEGYIHQINVQGGRGHGIDYRPGVAWIAQHQRNPWPDTIVWTGKPLDEKRRSRMYWIQIDGQIDARAIQLRAHADRVANTIDLAAHFLEIDGDGGNPTHAGPGQVIATEPAKGIAIRLLLHDDLIDLDKPLRVTCNGQVVFEGKVERDGRVMLQSLVGYGDPAMSGYAQVQIPLD